MKRSSPLRRTPLKRRSQLKRSAWMSRAKRGGKYARRSYVKDEAYRRWCATQPCACEGRDPSCSPRLRVHAHHTIKRDDRSCIPLSSWCHLRGWHGRVGGRTGWIGAMSLEERNRWGQDEVAKHRARFFETLPVCSSCDPAGAIVGLCAYCVHRCPVEDRCRECVDAGDDKAPLVCPCCVPRHRETHAHLNAGAAA